MQTSHTPRLFVLLLVLTLAPALCPSCSDSSGAEKAFARGATLYAQRQMPQAEAAFIETLRLHGNHVQARTMLGRLFYFQRKFDKAAKFLREAVELQPDNVDALFWLARTISVRPEGRKEAMALLDRTLQLDASHPEALLLKGLLHEQGGEHKQAVAAYRALIYQEVLIARAHERMSKMYDRAGMKAEAARAKEWALRLRHHAKARGKQETPAPDPIP